MLLRSIQAWNRPCCRCAQSSLRAHRLREYSEKLLSPVTGVSLTAAIVVGAAMTVAGAAVVYFAAEGWRGLVFEHYDMNVYFDSARWVIEGGRLYREVPSAYPPLANIIFAAVRYLSNLFHSGIYGFFGLWIASTWVIYLFAVYRIATDTTMLGALAWLTPASIYFALFRFDLYPAVATLMSLFAIRRAAYIEGAIWLGVAIALKGYALWLLPAYCVFMVYQRGFAAVMKVGAVALAPMTLSLLVALPFTGWEGVAALFKFHALRTLNGESTYDAFNYLFSVPVISDGPEVRWVAQSLQVGCALAAAAMRPRNFDDLINAFLFALLGFISFSVFYSPQFVLWILPLVCFSNSRVMLISAIVFSWITYLEFPISRYARYPDLFNAVFSCLTYLEFPISRLARHPDLFKAAIIAVSLLRLFMMFLAIRGAFRSPTKVPKENGRPDARGKVSRLK
jgi:hypothetical protein